jgi:hypothetical protein
MNPTRKVIYCVTDMYGVVKGPSYGRFFSEFPQSPEGQESQISGIDHLKKATLALTWMLNQPGSVLLACPYQGRSALWTVQIDEPISKE